jgi:immunity protein Imm5 of predicted polymorphic toxin system
MSVTLPAALQQRINEALDAMRANPTHHLAPSYRKAIYEAIGPKQDAFVMQVRGWLAIIAVQRVVPIFQQVIPDEPLPQQLLDAAQAILLGAANTNAVHELEDEAYLRFGHWLGYSQEVLGYDGEMAAFVTYKALVEIRTIIEGRPYDLLEDLHEFQRPADTTSKDVTKWSWITGDQWTDEDWASTAAKGDTASSAAVASACGFNTYTCDPQNIQAFWEWWLNEAIPSAWEMASSA